jgi:hypothetical protein
VSGAHNSGSVTHYGETTVASDDAIGAPTTVNPHAENATVTGGGQVGEQRRQVGPASASAPLTSGSLYLISQLGNNCRNQIIHGKIGKG